jgi:hypothetical protein
MDFHFYFRSIFFAGHGLPVYGSFFYQYFKDAGSVLLGQMVSVETSMAVPCR